MKYLLLIVSLVLFHNSWAKNLHVGKQHTYRTIGAALLQALAGDSIIVHTGTYREGSILVNKMVHLKGIGYPVIDGAFRSEGFHVVASGVSIQGFRIINTGSSSTEDLAGIKISGASNVTVRFNVLDNTVFGIYLRQATRCIVDGNTITAYGKVEQSSGNGIHCWKSDSLKIVANRISGHRDGIYFEFVTNSAVWRNHSEKNIRYGLHFMFSNNDHYISNHFRNNGAGVAVMYSYHVRMQHNRFYENWGDASYGLLLKEIRDSFIEHNIFERNTSAIYMEGASRIAITHNIFRFNGWGMKMQANCMDLVVSKCNFIGNTFDVATNGSLVLNKFDGNYWDKYEGYDLNKDRIGDVPYRPVSMYSMIIEKNPPAMLLFRSLITALLDKSEKVLPTITPENLIDNYPRMKPIAL